MTALKFAKPIPRRAEKRRKAAAHRAEMAEIRARVVARARWRCECGCGRSLLLHGLEIDHMFGGSGRRRQAQAVETCWALTPLCHAAKTRNHPSRAAWLAKWAEHCARHGLSPDAPGLRKVGAA